MAFFEVHVTPIRYSKQSERNADVVEVTPKLILAPFNPTPEVDFGCVQINSISTKYFKIYNPSRFPVQVHIVEHGLAEERIKISETEFCLLDLEEKHIDVTWSPVFECVVRKVIHISNATSRIKTYDVVVKGKCVNPTKMKKSKSKPLKKSQFYNKRPAAKITANKSHAMTILNRTVVINKLIDESNAKFIVNREENKENNQPIAASSPVLEITKKYTNSVQENNGGFSIINKETTIPKKIITTTTTTNIATLTDITSTPEVCSRNTSFFPMKGLASALDKVGLSPETFAVNLRRSTFAIDPSEKYDNDSNLPPCIVSMQGDQRNNGCSSSISFSDSLNSSYNNDECKSASYKTALSTPFKPDAGSDDTKIFQTPSSQGFLLKTNFNGGTEDITVEHRRQLLEDDLLVISPPATVNCSRRKSKTPRRYRRSLSTSKLLTPCSLKKKMRKKKTPSPKSKSAMKRFGLMKPLYAAHSDDPFFKMLAYHDEEWLDKQEVDIIKWMNSLLTPPVELQQTTDERWTVDDVAEMWVKGSQQEGAIKLAPSKEYFASVLYHCPQQLNSLRKAALIFYHSDPIAGVLSKLSSSIEKKTLTIREDRDLHLDQGLRSKLLHLLGSYNPLWLRIGLEVIYDQKIPIVAKCDIGGLGNFIRKNLFTNEYISKKHSHATVVNMKLPTFKNAMKKFILKKILMLIYYLDKAKSKKLIRHDPCLFSKSSEYKSSKDVLLAFCGDLVVGHGDIIKHLKYMNYILTYKQTCLDEYDYSVVTLLSLRDGVHIARMLEILIGPSVDLCSKLRVPAISLLQKQHNVRVSLEALQTICQIKGNITAQDIARGYREKTLSFLWQLINNYVAPRYNKAASVVQRSWRSFRLRNAIADRIESKRTKSSAAVRIQIWWRNNGLRREIKRRICRRRVQNLVLSLPTEHFRRVYYQLVSKYYHSPLLSSSSSPSDGCSGWSSSNDNSFHQDRILLMCAVIVVQHRFRANRLSFESRRRFLRLKCATLTVQRRFRADRLMRAERSKFIRLKRAVLVIQNRFRSKKLALQVRSDYLRLKAATRLIQNQFRRRQLLRRDRTEFLRLKSAAIVVQRRFVANVRMKNDRRAFLKRKSACMAIQTWYRSTVLMRTYRNRYLLYKLSVVAIENFYIRYRSMKRERESFIRLKKATVTLQSFYRARLSMRRQVVAYQTLKSSCLTIQRRYRANKLMQRDRAGFTRLKSAVKFVQDRYRAKRSMLRCRNEYAQLKQAVTMVQRRFRATLVARQYRSRFLILKSAVSTIELRYRAIRQMRSQRDDYLRLRSATLSVQRKFRTNSLAKKTRRYFLTLKSAAIAVQRRYRALMLMRRERSRYLTLKRNAIIIQKWYRGCSIVVPSCREAYLRKRNAVLIIQRAYRSYRTMKMQRRRFLLIKRSVIALQSAYRMRACRRRFLALKNATVFVQRLYRRKLTRRSVEKNEAAIKIQAFWKGYRVRKMKLLKQFVMLARNEKLLIKGTLRDRYLNAVSLLKTNDMYNVVIRALYNLDCVTNLSGKLCEDLTGEGIVDLIMGYLQRANRSLPSLELNKMGIKVLINLARHKPTASIVWSALKENVYGGLSHLIHVMKYTHEKFADVLFLHATTLLWILINDELIAQEVAKIDVVRKQIDHMVSNLHRKSTINLNIRKPRPIYPSQFPSWHASFKDPFFNDHYFAACAVQKRLTSTNPTTQ